MARVGAIVASIVLLCAVAAGVWWYLQPQPPEPRSAEGTAEDRQQQEEQTTGPAAPEAEYPIPGDGPDAGAPQGEELADAGDDDEPAREDEAPESGHEVAPRAQLPPLARSDSRIRTALATVVTPGILEYWLKDERIVERIVATVNSLDGEAIPLRFWPVRHIQGLPLIVREGERMYWSPSNSERYVPLIELLQGTAPEELAAVYFRHYPLFQEAYAKLGLEDAYFNDRLVEIVDHLLGAPEIPLGFEVKQPKVLYEFADPALESESWGRKLLMRMGPENSIRVKAWLRSLRAELVLGRAERAHNN